MRKAFLFTYFSLILLICFSQSNESEVISASGECFEESGISLSWTLGETINETFSNENIILTQGFQQKITSQTESQEYLFSIGYQFVSSRIISENPDMLDVLENILNQNLDFVRNSAGNMLRKIGPVWVNGIGDWITTEGYLFKMSGQETLSISGLAINPQTPISLSTGYQIISFLPDEQQNASDVFENILENLDFVRNSSGNMFRKIGPVWVNGIGNMKPCEAYLVKMYANDILIYPEEAKNIIVDKKFKPEHFQVSGGNPYDPVWTIYFEKGNLNFGDEIGVYVNEILVGSAVINSDNIFENEIPVFSNLYKIGNKPVIKVWNKSENQEYIVNDFVFSNPYGDSWLENVLASEDGDYSFLHFSTTEISDEIEINQTISIYPNPTKGLINIENIAGFKNLQGLKITDIAGKTVFQSNNTKLGRIKQNKSVWMGNINNQTTIELNLSQFEKGVYFISLVGSKFTQVEKIIVQ